MLVLKGRKKGFTLIEMLIVIIIGLLASLIVPRLLSKLSESKEKITKDQISMLSTALDLYKADVGSYPNTKDELEALVKKPNDIPNSLCKGPYLKNGQLPKDPCDHPYHYFGPDSDITQKLAKEYPSTEYIIISYGADNKPGGKGEDGDISNLDEKGTELIDKHLEEGSQ